MSSVLTLSENEFEEWLTHTTECFAWKGTPKSHFENHFLLDPEKLTENILVVKDTKAGIVSSLRIFSRQILIDGQVVPVGGIGEVLLLLKYYVLFDRSNRVAPGLHKGNA